VQDQVDTASPMGGIRVKRDIVWYQPVSARA
jgi:hypothetical protein